MNKVYLGILTVLALATLAMGQKQTPERVAADPQKSERATLASGTNISAELQKSLDVNSTKVGDQVTLKTTQSIKHDGHVIVPKGSTLLGRVTEIQRRTKDNVQSRIGMVFDRIQGRDLAMPLNATIVSVINAGASLSAGDSLMTETSGSTMTSGSASTSRQSSSGGLLGGVGSTVGGLVGTTTQTVGSVANTAGQTLGSTTGAATRTVNGLTISAEASGSANTTTTLSSPNKNLRFEKGSTFNLRVAN